MMVSAEQVTQGSQSIRHYFWKGYYENHDDAAKPACDLCLIFIVQILYILFFILLSLIDINWDKMRLFLGKYLALAW